MQNDLAFIQALLGELNAFFTDRAGGRFAVGGSDKTEPGDLVTEIDVACQRIILDRIRAAFPRDEILAEEEGCDVPPRDSSLRCWVIDPLDGTYNFQRTLSPAYAVSIALVRDAEPVAAGVLVPELGLQYLARKGGGATCNGRPLSVSSIADLGEAKVDVDFSERSRRNDCLSASMELMRRASQVRSTGSTVVALCSVAQGLTEVFTHPCPKAWDIAAGKLLVEEAGGRFTRFNGDPVRLLDDREDILVTNGWLHTEALGLVGRSRDPGVSEPPAKRR